MAALEARKAERRARFNRGGEEEQPGQGFAVLVMSLPMTRVSIRSASTLRFAEAPWPWRRRRRAFRDEEESNTAPSTDREPPPASGAAGAAGAGAPGSGGQDAALAGAGPDPARTVVEREPLPDPDELDVQTAAEGDQDLGPVADGEAALVGRMRQPDGTVVAGIEVRLRPLRREEVVAETYTDEEGRFHFPRVKSGRYKLDFGPADSPTGYAPDRLRLEPGDNQYDFRTPRLGGLRVEAYDAGGKRLLEGARVVVKGNYGRSWKATTNAQGSADFPFLPVGSYRVLLFQSEVRVDQQQQSVLAQVTSEVTLRATALSKTAAG